jgi:EAL domain-containing protein (putative c-di-GMP-specific phosphodiesterase class I)
VGLATTQGGIAIHCQPIVNLGHHSIVGYELLMRPRNGLRSASPMMIFQHAIELGLLAVLDEHCLREAIKALDAIESDAHCHINLYPSTLLHLSTDTLRSYFDRPDASRICVELSEQQIIGDPTYLLPPLGVLRDLGVTIALDDVGFGRTALESLIVLEPEIVKIDRMYVDGVAEDMVRQGWLRRLVRSAQSLDATLVAEGVERKDDVETLRQLGVELAQGYLYGRAEPIEEVAPVGPLSVAR